MQPFLTPKSIGPRIIFPAPGSSRAGVVNFGHSNCLGVQPPASLAYMANVRVVVQNTKSAKVSPLRL